LSTISGAATLARPAPDTEPLEDSMHPQSICSIEKCSSPRIARGFCSIHYRRWKRTGDPLVLRGHSSAPLPAATRFWAKVDKSGECWLWTASLTKDGYGKFGPAAPHRFSYELMVGPIPEGLQIDHLCRVRHCVNPAHLEAVSGRENTMRGNTITAQNFAKTHCPVGHAFDEANTYVWKTRRHCRACDRERQRKLRLAGANP
jgi:hypothetical protein